MPEAQQSRANAFGKASLFSGLSERELGYLLDRVVPRSYSSGEIVFSEGEPCAGLYVVESGSIRIFKSSSGGREQVLSIEGPGGSVAELPVFDGGNYPASVIAIQNTVLLHGLCLAHPEVALKFLRVVGAPASEGYVAEGEWQVRPEEVTTTR